MAVGERLRAVGSTPSFGRLNFLMDSEASNSAEEAELTGMTGPWRHVVSRHLCPEALTVTGVADTVLARPSSLSSRSFGGVSRVVPRLRLSSVIMSLSM